MSGRVQGFWSWPWTKTFIDVMCIAIALAILDWLSGTKTSIATPIAIVALVNAYRAQVRP